jgi:hypothetical protein
VIVLFLLLRVGGMLIMREPYPQRKEGSKIGKGACSEDGFKSQA